MCDQDHDYNDEQKAFDGGKMDKFPTTVATTSGTSPTGQACSPSDVMSYYDGNTVTGLWNYAKTFAMSDNFFGTTFGPSAPGAISHGYLSPDHLPAVSFLKAPATRTGTPVTPTPTTSSSSSPRRSTRSSTRRIGRAPR